MKRTLSLGAATLAITFFLAGCNQYADGPALSFKSPFSRVVNKWKVEYAVIDGEDKTFRYDSASFEFLEDGSIEFVNVDGGDSLIQEGLWDLVEDDSQVRIIYTDPAIFPDLAYWDINRLKEKEMWVTEDQDTAIYEFRLIPFAD